MVLSEMEVHERGAGGRTGGGEGLTRGVHALAERPYYHASPGARGIGWKGRRGWKHRVACLYTLGRHERLMLFGALPSLCRVRSSLSSVHDGGCNHSGIDTLDPSASLTLYDTLGLFCFLFLFRTLLLLRLLHCFVL